MPAKSRPGKATTTAKSKPKPSIEIAKPQWPPLKPLVPTSDLCLDVLLEDQIVLIRKFFTNSLCQKYVSFLSSLPLTTTPGNPKKGEALRVNDRYQVEDAAFAAQLWNTTGLVDLILQNSSDWGGTPVDDESNNTVLPTTPPTLAKTTWTLLIYLTTCGGGQTAFYPEHGQVRNRFKAQENATEPVVVDPEIGLALLHKHGDDCLLHEGREITEGEKWVIRSDLCVRR